MEQKTKKIVQILIGLAIGLFACLFLWGTRIITYNSTTYFVSGKPDLVSGVIALVIIAISAWRGLLNFHNEHKWISIMVFVIDLTIFATIFSLITPQESTTGIKGLFAMMKKEVFYTVVFTFCITMLVFGMKNLAKLAIFITPILILSKGLSIASDAFDFDGFLVLVGITVCFIMQNSINPSAIKQDISLLYSKSNRAIEGAAQETKAIGDAVVDAGKKAIEIASKSNV